MAAVLMGGFRLTRSRARCRRGAAAQAGVQYSNTKELGKLLYTEYLYPLEIAAVILLVAIVAAIALTLRQRKDSKYIDPADAGARARRATACSIIRCRRRVPAEPAADAAARPPPGDARHDRSRSVTS